MSQRPRRGLPPEESAAIDAFLAQQGVDMGEENADLVREMVATAIRFAKQKPDRGDMKIVNTAVKELRHAFAVFARYRHARKVTIFGSARLGPDTPECRTAHACAALLAERGFMVITGGASGIMGAGNAGAGRAMSFGVNILLPFEQGANPTLEGDEKLIWFKYFFTRKLVFVKESDAIVLFAGGFGTQDELFEVLTLTQTGKNRPMPIVLVESPGGAYWRGWERFVSGEILSSGLASADDAALYRIVQGPEAAVAEVTGFFKNYHSSRFVGDAFVIRLNRPIPRAALETLGGEFRDIITAGSIETSNALRGEESDTGAAGLPRLVFAFDRRHYARLRVMIDRINSLY